MDLRKDSGDLIAMLQSHASTGMEKDDSQRRKKIVLFFAFLWSERDAKMSVVRREETGKQTDGGAVTKHRFIL